MNPCPACHGPEHGSEGVARACLVHHLSLARHVADTQRARADRLEVELAPVRRIRAEVARLRKVVLP
jgi:hypothetical protein